MFRSPTSPRDHCAWGFQVPISVRNPFFPFYIQEYYRIPPRIRTSASLSVTEKRSELHASIIVNGKQKNPLPLVSAWERPKLIRSIHTVLINTEINLFTQRNEKFI